MKKIENIIFDLGNVIVNLNPELAKKEFEKLGYNINLLKLRDQEKKLLDSFEVGLLSPEEFRFELKKNLKLNVSDTEIDFAWNSILLDVPKERIELLNTLKKKYRLFLLSNTNKIHIDCFRKYLKETYGMNDLSFFFEKEYLSHEMGLRKPDEKIFSQVLEENNLIPQRTLFIDDLLENVLGADKTEIITWHLKQPQTILEIDFDRIC